MSELRLPSASLDNEFLRLDYLTTSGPRIIGLYSSGVEGNLLAETPDVHWSTPHGEYYLRGGHRLWTAPEDPFYTCPEEGLEVSEGKDKVTLRSPIDASSLEKEIAIRLEGNRVHLSHRITWRGANPIELAPWGITQLPLGGMAILPLSNKDGLLPDRNLVFWPYSHMKDDRLELLDDLVLVHGRPAGYAFKIGNHNSHGWMAYALGRVLLVKRFSVNKPGSHPDLGCNVEIYVNDGFIELETLGVVTVLQPNDSVTHEETWEVIEGEYPASLQSAREISRQLS